MSSSFTIGSAGKSESLKSTFFIRHLLSKFDAKF